MTRSRPDFIVIGAMKCATTTLHAQLARQPGLFMSRIKEPNYFSDDEVFARGPAWYESLFREAGERDCCGEASTHYSKRPTYPRTVDRLARARPHVKLIYVMRHPIDRLVSHYVHECTVGRIAPGTGLAEAIEGLPELVDYGRYAMQLRPYREAFGAVRILPVFFRGLALRPQEELERIGRFLGVAGPLRWDETVGPLNVGSERLRRSLVREMLVRAPLVTTIRRRLVPRAGAEALKALWRARLAPPPVPHALKARLAEVFDDDLAQLGTWLGIALNCDNFREVTASRPYDWVEGPCDPVVEGSDPSAGCTKAPGRPDASHK
jgi:hypothetical protein